MFPDLCWDFWHDWGRLRSWISEILDRVAYTRAFCSWQATGVIKDTAMSEDGERPEEKPRPPAGGKTKQPSKPELVPILVA